MGDEKSIKEIGFDRYWKAVNPDSSETTIILQAHLLCEYYINQIVLRKIPRGDILLKRTVFDFQVFILVCWQGFVNA